MHTLAFKAIFDSLPLCYLNTKQALRRIGECDPHKIKRTTLKKRRPKRILNDNDYFNRGILNVRKELNGHLRRGGCFSSSVIKKFSKAKIEVTANGHYITVRIPDAPGNFARIVKAIYSLLEKCDPICCKNLWELAEKDTSRPTAALKNIDCKTVAPLQTKIVRVSHATKAGREIKDYVATL